MILAQEIEEAGQIVSMSLQVVRSHYRASLTQRACSRRVMKLIDLAVWQHPVNRLSHRIWTVNQCRLLKHRFQYHLIRFIFALSVPTYGLLGYDQAIRGSIREPEVIYIFWLPIWKSQSSLQARRPLWTVVQQRVCSTDRLYIARKRFAHHIIQHLEEADYITLPSTVSPKQ